MIVYDEEKNKRYGYACKTYRKDKYKLVRDLKQMCKSENKELEHVGMY